jgi:hypothetical protein
MGFMGTPEFLVGGVRAAAGMDGRLSAGNDGKMTKNSSISGA